MRLKSLFLYLIGAFLLLFGNRDLWDELQEEQEKADEQAKLVAEAQEAAAKKFEVQTLVVDSASGKLINPYPYFQLINASYVNFKAINRGKKTTVELDDDEHASDSF